MVVAGDVAVVALGDAMGARQNNKAPNYYSARRLSPIHQTEVLVWLLCHSAWVVGSRSVRRREGARKDDVCSLVIIVDGVLMYSKLKCYCGYSVLPRGRSAVGALGGARAPENNTTSSCCFSGGMLPYSEHSVVAITKSLCIGGK